MGRLRVGQAGARAAHGVGHRGDRLRLADHAPGEPLTPS